MKYTIRTIAVLVFLLIGFSVNAANDENIFTKTTEWTPVNSSMSIGSSSYRGGGSSSRSYNSGENRTYRVVSTQTSHSSGYNGGVAARGGSYNPSASSSSSQSRDYHYGSVSATSQFDGETGSIVEDQNDFFDESFGLPGQQRVRGHAKGNPGFATAKSPMTDAIPCLVIMILGVAIWKYRKMM